MSSEQPAQNHTSKQIEVPSVSEPKECVDFKVIYNKKKYDVNFPLDDTIGQLKLHLQDITGDFSSSAVTMVA